VNFRDALLVIQGCNSRRAHQKKKKFATYLARLCGGDLTLIPQIIKANQTTTEADRDVIMQGIPQEPEVAVAALAPAPTDNLIQNFCNQYERLTKAQFEHQLKMEEQKTEQMRLQLERDRHEANRLGRLRAQQNKKKSLNTPGSRQITDFLVQRRY